MCKCEHLRATAEPLSEDRPRRSGRVPPLQTLSQRLRRSGARAEGVEGGTALFSSHSPRTELSAPPAFITSADLTPSLYLRWAPVGGPALRVCRQTAGAQERRRSLRCRRTLPRWDVPPRSPVLCVAQAEKKSHPLGDSHAWSQC
ncbi:hypothetical protein AOLI_G00057010 [Acnodon oligacanthus]